MVEGVHYGNEIKRLNGFESRLDLHGFSDADWASDLRTRRSTGGFVVYACGGPMSWGSKLMTTAAASSMESEYMGAFRLGQELLFVTNVGEVLKLPFTRKIPFFMDAMAAIQSLKNPTCRARTKHISTKWFWIHQYVGRRFELYHIRTGDMVADLLTKSVISRLWNVLVHHLLGKKQIVARNMIEAQLRAKGLPFPEELVVDHCGNACR